MNPLISDRLVDLIDAAVERADAVVADKAPDLDPEARAAVDAAQALEGACGLVHATPTGMAKLPGLPLDAALLHPGLWVSEVVYFPLETELLRTARALGCPISDGGGMAVGRKG